MSVSSIRKPLAALAAALAFALALALTGCSPASDEADPATPAPAAPPATAPAEDPGAVQATANALAALTTEELRARAHAALREQRLHSPAGANAIEYYLALRQKSAEPDVSAESALIDLAPWALIASEQAINDGDFAEAERLLELMTRSDPEAPALGRIRDAIARGRTAATDRERLEAERRAREEAAATAAAAAPAALTAPAVAAAPVPAPPTPEPVQVAPPPVVAAAPAPVVAAPARLGPPIAISAPPPPYPREAARSRASGSVTVQFTIGADGRVSDVQVLRARPRGLFDDSVRETVLTWRFEPPGEPVTVNRTFDFRM